MIGSSSWHVLTVLPQSLEYEICLADETVGRAEDVVRLSLPEVGLQCVAELLGILDKLPLANVEYLLNLGRLHGLEQIIDGIEFLFDGRCDFLDSFEKSFAVVYLVRYAAENELELFGARIELFELGSFDQVFVRGQELLGSEYHFLHVGASVVHLQDLVDQVIRESRIDGVNFGERVFQVGLGNGNGVLFFHLLESRIDEVGHHQ